MIRIFIFIRLPFHPRRFASFWFQGYNFASIIRGHEKAKRITMQGMVLTAKFPKLFEGFCGISTLENLPRSTVEAGVGMVET
jgi:hypothetical protein